jgi:hypothetical protein
METASESGRHLRVRGVLSTVAPRVRGLLPAVASRLRGSLPAVAPRVRGSLPLVASSSSVASSSVSALTPGDPAAQNTVILSTNAIASPGLLDENGSHYKNDQIRALAKRTLRRAGIDEDRPYHIKHAMVSLLYNKRLPPEQIALFLRQKVDSFTFFNNYVSNDLGRQCSDAIVAEFTKVNCFLWIDSVYRCYTDIHRYNLLYSR